MEGLNRKAPTLAASLGAIENFEGFDDKAGLAAMPERERARWLLKELEGCTDTLPATECKELDLPLGSSYATAVDHLHRLLNHEMAREICAR